MRQRQLVIRTALLVALAMTAAWPAEARRSPTPQETPAEEPRGAWSSAPPEARDCSRVRRKFWQPDQGWVVRTVVACR